MERIKFTSLVISLALLNACGNEGAKMSFSSVRDFSQTSIQVSGLGVADGRTYLYFEIKVMNSNDTPVVNFGPNLEVSDGVHRGCSLTNSYGISRCAMTSATVGQKEIRVINIPSPVSTNLTFIAPSPPGATVLSQTAMGSHRLLPSGHEVSLSFSYQNQPPRREHNSGYKIYNGGQGLLIDKSFD